MKDIKMKVLGVTTNNKKIILIIIKMSKHQKAKKKN